MLEVYNRVRAAAYILERVLCVGEQRILLHLHWLCKYYDKLKIIYRTSASNSIIRLALRIIVLIAFAMISEFLSVKKLSPRKAVNDWENHAESSLKTKISKIGWMKLSRMNLDFVDHRLIWDLPVRLNWNLKRNYSKVSLASPDRFTSKQFLFIKQRVNINTSRHFPWNCFRLPAWAFSELCWDIKALKSFWSTREKFQFKSGTQKVSREASSCWAEVLNKKATSERFFE